MFTWIKIIVKDTSKIKTQTFDIIPIKGSKYTVSDDHILILKASNYEGISWNKGRQCYMVQWVQNFAIKYKTFAEKNYESEEIALKEARKFLKNIVPKLDGYTKYGDIVKITVKNFMKLPKRFQNIYKIFSKGIDIEEEKVDIDPYVLGYWLGDGVSSGPLISTAEEEVIEYFTDFATKNNLNLKYYSGYSYGITNGKKSSKGSNIFLNFLKNNDLINNKHIPDDYKMNSKENRLKILAGIIDSDGHYSNGIYDIVLKSEK